MLRVPIAVGVPSSLQVMGLSLSVSLKSIASALIWMVSMPVSCDSEKLICFQTVEPLMPPESTS
jgi:hypothetical protein